MLWCRSVIMCKGQFLLWINITMFSSNDTLVVDTSLPGGNFGLKHFFNIFQSPARSFGKEEKDMNSHHRAEHGKDDISLPFDVGKGRRDKVAERKVKDPVGRGAEGDSLATKAQGKEFGRVDPRDGSPCGRLRNLSEPSWGHGVWVLTYEATKR